MANTILSLNLSDAVHELASTGPELESALESFERQLKSERTLGKPPRSSTGIRLPRLPMWRPVIPRLRLPHRLRTTIPATVLRRGKSKQNAGLSNIGADLQAGVQRVADSVRARLLDLRKKLQTFHRDFALFSEAVHLAGVFLPARRRV